ncbi:hypothetical protein SAMN02910292_01041 [Lachnospiraceae bacterium XBB2008]|nr:hypothetical protein SAMN02910292_01041 [Lachnospiraceae bacterium XBB2008]
MMKERQIGGKLLKSAIAVLMAVTVAVLTLPAFKMDVKAAETTTYVAMQGFDAPANIFRAIEFERIGSSATLKAGESIFVPDWSNQLVVNGLDRLAEVNNNASVQYDLGSQGPESGTLYTLKRDVTFSINENTIEFFDAGGGSSAETPAAPGSVKPDPAAIQNALARIAAEEAALAQQREADRIYKDKLLQSQIDNQYFRNLNEAKARGKNMIVQPDTHAVTASTVKGTYLSEYSNGIAVTAVNSLANPNLYIETWDITDKKAPDAMRSINDEVTRLGGTLVGALQINIGVKNGKGETVYDGDGTSVANVKFGIPNDGGKYAIVQVQALSDGPSIKTFGNLDIENGVATLSLPIGQAAYAVVKLPN